MLERFTFGEDDLQWMVNVWLIRVVGIICGQDGEFAAIHKLLDARAAILRAHQLKARPQLLRVFDARFLGHADAGVTFMMFDDHRKTKPRFRNHLFDVFAQAGLQPARKCDILALGHHLGLFARRRVENAVRAGEGQVQGFERLHHVNARTVFIRRTIAKIQIHIVIFAQGDIANEIKRGKFNVIHFPFVVFKIRLGRVISKCFIRENADAHVTSQLKK